METDNIETGIIGAVITILAITLKLSMRSCAKDNNKMNIKKQELHYDYLKSHPGCEVSE